MCRTPVIILPAYLLLIQLTVFFLLFIVCIFSVVVYTDFSVFSEDVAKYGAYTAAVMKC